jgi:hypothetical protein
MLRLSLLPAAALIALFVMTSGSTAQEAPQSYPITFEANDVHTVDLAVEVNSLKLTGTDLIVIPLRIESGITGAMLIGNGEYVFSPEDGDEIKGKFRAAMLRFHPDDQAKFLTIDPQQATTDLAAHEMGRHMLDNVFRHCWHRGNEALIPTSGSFVANVYSTTQGDLLISTGQESSVVHSFTDKKTLYASK